jgi:hypothetical protein
LVDSVVYNTHGLPSPIASVVYNDYNDDENNIEKEEEIKPIKFAF